VEAYLAGMRAMVFKGNLFSNRVGYLSCALFSYQAEVRRSGQVAEASFSISCNRLHSALISILLSVVFYLKDNIFYLCRFFSASPQLPVLFVSSWSCRFVIQNHHTYIYTM